ncbi:MAG: hypothetical protein JF590_01690 [Gemmatimonadetes bacterium]|nr:hypothetical protein [Gemmatimonadota bacterium]
MRVLLLAVSAIGLLGCDALTQPFGAESWAAVAPGDIHTCALTDAAAVSCWGSNASGQLGTPTTAAISRRPLPLLLGPVGVEAVVSGVSMSCALLADHRALCWGEGATAPVEVASGRAFRQVAVGQSACGVTSAGEVWCWTSPSAAAFQIPGSFPDGEIAVGWDSGCALAPTAGISCWPFSSSVASQLPGTAGSTYHGLTMGDFHGCAIGDDGVARCWGTNASGQLGDSSHTTRAGPTPVVRGARSAGDLFRALRAYGNITCGVTEGRGGYCWGQGTTVPQVTPGITKWTALAPGLNHVCGFAASNGDLYCFGANDDGQLGDGTILFAPEPVKVIGP